MVYSVSTLPIIPIKLSGLDKLDRDVGIEIMIEFGSDYFWRSELDLLFRERTGPFSIHAPFINFNIANPALKESDLFSTMKWVFSLASSYNASHVVIHPNGRVSSATENEKLQMTFQNRLEGILDIAKDNQIPLCVENLPGGLRCFSQSQYIELFENNPSVFSLIDIGHLHLAGWDLTEVASRLKDRILAYHIHDNDGNKDSHLPVGRGTIKWNEVYNVIRTYTPDANLVLEYENTTLDELIAESNRLKQYVFA